MLPLRRHRPLGPRLPEEEEALDGRGHVSMCLLLNPGRGNGCRSDDRDRSRGDDASVLGARVPGDAVPLHGHLLSARPPHVHARDNARNDLCHRVDVHAIDATLAESLLLTGATA